jgi:hypothetical protein
MVDAGPPPVLPLSWPVTGTDVKDPRPVGHPDPAPRLCGRQPSAPVVPTVRRRSAPPEPERPEAYRDVRERLLARFSPSVPAEEVDRCLDECIARLASAPVRTYLPVLVERAAVDRLKARR